MSDELLDRELTALLSVEPSPDFVARVRMRVSAEPLARVPWSAARWLAVAVVAIIAVGTLIGLWTSQSAPVAVEQAHVAARTAAPVAQPQVLVSPSESRVVERLLIAARGARLDSAARSPGDAPLDPPTPIAIEPLRVEPLATITSLESGVIQ